MLGVRLRGTGMVLEVEAIVTHTGSLTPGNRRLHVIETVCIIKHLSKGLLEDSLSVGIARNNRNLHVITSFP